MFAQVSDFAARLLSGGTLEIVLLIVIIIVAVILLLVALWILWKLAVLLGKGLLWLFRFGNTEVQKRRATKREERLAAPPAVAAGWSTSTRLGLRGALLEARRLAGPDALRIVVVAGEGASDLFRGLGLTPPGAGRIGISATGDLVLINAAAADGRMLRRLARALPWRRPIDGMAALVDPSGIPSEALARASSLARHLGLRSAMHFVFPSSGVAAWQVVDARNRNGDTVCTQLATDAARAWLAEGERAGLKDLALAQSREMPGALDRALSVAPAAVDVASLCLGGVGLRAAVAQTTDRTQPDSARSLGVWAGVAVLAAGALLTGLAAVHSFNRADGLQGAVDTAFREAAVPWSAEGIGTIPSGGRVHRIAGTSVRLAETSGFSLLVPFAPLAPNASAATDLGASFLEAYVLAPLADGLDRQARRRLMPTDEPRFWVDEARTVSEWLAAYEGLDDDPEEVDIRRLFVAAFGGDQGAWPEGIDVALVRTDARLPPLTRGGLDVVDLTRLARDNFVTSMQRWADRVYTNGPVAAAARRAIDRSANWRDQHEALVGLRTALQDPAQQWLTAAEDRSDYGYELRVLGRATALPILGSGNALDAKAAVSRVRIDARESAEYFALPGIGPLMVRPSTGGPGDQRGPSLALSPGVESWVSFLDRVANAGFAELPEDSGSLPLAGPVTVDVTAIAQARNRLRIFDQFAADVPTGLPAAVAQRLVNELASELVVGVTVDVEQALRSATMSGTATEHAQRLVRVAPALADLAEIEAWLAARLADSEADRAFNVRSRVAENVLAASAEALAEEDPLGIYVDPAADGNALVRRFERGLARMRRMHEQFAAPFIEPGVAGGWATLDWQHITNDIQAHERGDGASALSGLEGMVRAWAEDPVAACDAPPAALVAGRDDYIARALSRLRSEMDTACRRTAAEEAARVYQRLVQFFDQYVAWLWPYSLDRNAPELQASTLDAFVARLYAARDALERVDEPFARDLVDHASFWEQNDDGGAVVRFRIHWRARPSDERLAENVIAYELRGTDVDEDGVHTWRYGSPLALGIRLAKNSDYRFRTGNDPDRRELVIEGEGNGALLRLFSGLSSGAIVFEADVEDAEGNPRRLRVTARVTHPDGAVMTMPRFAVRLAGGGSG